MPTTASCDQPSRSEASQSIPLDMKRQPGDALAVAESLAPVPAIQHNTSALPGLVNHPAGVAAMAPTPCLPGGWLRTAQPHMMPMELLPTHLPHAHVATPEQQQLLAAMASFQGPHRQVANPRAPAAGNDAAGSGDETNEGSTKLSLNHQPLGVPLNTEQSMKDAAEMLSNAFAMKRRRCLVSVDEVPGFVRTVYTLLNVCDSNIICWSEDGTKIVIKSSERFAREVCPKFFRHRNFNSFTRLLNMYQFHKVPTNRRESKDICFAHPHFQRGREDLLCLVQRKGAQVARDEMMTRELLEQSALAGVSALENALNPIHPTLIAHEQQQHEMAAVAACAAAAAAAASDPASWMQRMSDLESEVRELKKENERLKKLETERDGLLNDIRTQGDLINALHAQSTLLGALNSLAATEIPVSNCTKSSVSPSSSLSLGSSTSSDDDSTGKDEGSDPVGSTSSKSTISDVPHAKKHMQHIGSASAVAVILSMFGNAQSQLVPNEKLPAFGVTEGVSTLHQSSSCTNPAGTLSDGRAKKRVKA